MPIIPDHILKFLGNNANDKLNTELVDLLIKRINKLCLEECQIDRILCTLTPQCTRRFLLKLRIKNGLTEDDLPKFCYSVLKSTVQREFLEKTVVYRPTDVYLFLIDFLDIFFHGDYRKLNKFLSFKSWDEAKKILDSRIEESKENFQYHLTDNYFIFKFEDKLHIFFINKNYVLINATREEIASLELLKGLCELFIRTYNLNFLVDLEPSKYISIKTVISNFIISSIDAYSNVKKDQKATGDSIWDNFPQLIDLLSIISNEIHLHFDEDFNLEIELFVKLETNVSINFERVPLMYKDIKTMFDQFKRFY